MKLIDEKNDLTFTLRNLIYDTFQPFLKLSTEFCTGNERAKVKGKKTFVCKRLRNISLGNTFCKAFNNCSLTYTRFSNENRIVLCPPAENLHHPSDFLVSADYRIELVLSSKTCQILTVFIK